MKLAVGVAWSVFALCCVYPIVWMLFGTTGSGSAEAVARGFVAQRQRDLMANTIGLGLGVTALAVSIGVPAGIVLARCHPRRVKLARFLLIVPLALPSYVPAFAWIVVFGVRASWWVYSLPAAMLVLGFGLFPIVMLATEAALRRVPARLEEAGRLVATPIRVWLRISLPLIGPSLSASLFIVFVLALSDFAVPGLLRVRVYTMEVFTAFAAIYDFRLATLVALPIAAIAALASVAALVFARWSSVGRVDRGYSGTTWRRRTQSIAALAITLLAVAAVAVPAGAIALEARGGQSRFGEAVSVEAVRNTVVWSAAGATVVVLLGTLLGYWRAKAPERPAHVAEAVWVMLFAVPAAVVGVGLIGVWNRPGLLGDMYRTEAVVVLAYLARFLPIGALLCGAFLRRVPPGVEEAAVVAGASSTRTFTHIFVSMSRRGLAAVWLVMFILMCGDVALTILVAPPGEANLGVWAYTLIANAPTSEVAKLALMQMGIAVLPLAGIALLARDGSEQAW